MDSVTVTLEHGHLHTATNTKRTKVDVDKIFSTRPPVNYYLTRQSNGPFIMHNYLGIAANIML
jgi:hypothetical protein